MRVDTDAERAWLDHEVWRVACAIENTWTAQVFGAGDDAIAAPPVECELRYLEEIREMPIARRLWSRSAWGQEAALPAAFSE